MRKALCTLFLAGTLLLGCSPAPDQGTVIGGRIEQAENLQIFLDRIVIGKPGRELAKVYLGSDGRFSLRTDETLPAGIYQLRIGAFRLPVLLGEEDQEVEITASLSTLDEQDVTVRGSAESQAYFRFLQTHTNPFPEDVRQFIDTTSHPYAAAWLTFVLWRNRIDLLDLHQRAQARLSQAYPGSENAIQYATFIEERELEYAKQLADQRIQIGKPAPDISLPAPDGEVRSLHDLQGKVVLLDFWASWCGPCRQENPNVVRVYEKYKDEGFTIFSVSLDGLDSRTRARLSRPDQVEKVRQRERSKWLNAINQDKLSWPNHVSDLQGWESEAAAIYGVKSIPQTYLIDREGNIAAISLRGAAAIERELKELL